TTGGDRNRPRGGVAARVAGRVRRRGGDRVSAGGEGGERRRPGSPGRGGGRGRHAVVHVHGDRRAGLRRSTGSGGATGRHRRCRRRRRVDRDRERSRRTLEPVRVVGDDDRDQVLAVGEGARGGDRVGA